MTGGRSYHSRPLAEEKSDQFRSANTDRKGRHGAARGILLFWETAAQKFARRTFFGFCLDNPSEIMYTLNIK